MDIVIPLAKDKTHAYADLKYTLRSIDKNLSGYSNLYIIGPHKPNWIYNAEFISLDDVIKKKAYSIFRKMLLAAKNESVTDNFISWADDTYLMDKLNVNDFKAWYEGTLKEWSKRNINSAYKNIVINTMNLFPDGLFYNVHTPCIYNKERFKEIELYNFDQRELLVKSTYFNHYNEQGVLMKDPKQKKGLFYSSGGSGLKTSEVMMLKKYFPEISKYETNHKADSKAA